MGSLECRSSGNLYELRIVRNYEFVIYGEEKNLPHK